MMKPSVLLVDDEPQVLVALDDLLCDEFTVHKTESAEQALALAKQHPELAVVVTDQRMPKVTGDQLVASLSGCSDAARILLTGFADLSAVVRAVNEGHIFAYVTKPWNPDDLLLKVHKAVEHFRVSRALAEEQRLLRDLMDSVPDAIYFKDSDLRFLRVNRAHKTLLNGAHGDIVGKHLHDIAPDSSEVLAIEAAERKVLAGMPAVDVERSEGLNGSRRWFSESKAAITGPKGEALGLVGIARDITERKQQQERIARLTRIRAVTGGINAALVRMREPKPLLDECCRIAVEVGGIGAALALSFDAECNQVEVSSAEPAQCALVAALKARLQVGDEATIAALRALAESSEPQRLGDLAGAGFADAAGYRELATFRLSAPRQPPSMLCLFSQHEGFDEQELSLLSEVADNIAFGLEHIAKTQRLDFLAYHDELTRLANRSLFLDRLRQHIQTCADTGANAAVLVVDIGRFRQINETLGRNAGDHLLVQIAGRLSASVRPVDTVARFDSNTFAVLAMVDGQTEVARLVEGAVLPALKQCFHVGGTELRVAAKIGIALLPSDGDSAEAIVANAEAALKNAKQSVSGYLFYVPNMHDRVAERLTLETRLRRAVDANEFELHYQPKVDLRTGAVVGLEALMRWRDPEHGLVSPGQFIPLLEETGLIREMGRWAIEEAASQFMAWAGSGLRPPRIAVNVSAIQLAAPDLEKTLEDCPDSSGSIDLEITESVFVKDLAGSVSKLEAARRLGLKVAIDDFGTGYSSLGYLSRLPIDALKIDRSFIIGMLDDPQETTIVTTIISLAHAMDLKVIAEGVETQDQARLLRLLKCDQMQGYLVSRPQPAVDIAKLLGNTFSFAPPPRDAN
jgi:diguanylate cyclase (GGDEF)-like protein/PAS domain S-box-containing protein